MKTMKFSCEINFDDDKRVYQWMLTSNQFESGYGALVANARREAQLKGCLNTDEIDFTFYTIGGENTVVNEQDFEQYFWSLLGEDCHTKTFGIITFVDSVQYCPN